MSETRKPRDIQEETDHMVITCMDHRFQEVMGQRLQDEYGIDMAHSDRLAFPGASKAVADGTLIPAIQTSYRLHQIKTVAVVDHLDCGGFGGLAAFENDEEKETQAHAEYLAKASEAIHKVLPDLVVISFVATLDGELIQLAADKE